LRATTDALWIVADGAVLPFDGDLDDYRDWVLARSRGTAETGDAGAVGKRKAQKRAEAELRQREYAKRKPYAGKLAKLEREMAALNVEKKTLEDWLASPDAYTDAAKNALKERLLRQGDLTWQLARLEAEWLEISEAVEKLDAAGP
jgi:ATP-binding cassette subfamily F protein 3